MLNNQSNWISIKLANELLFYLIHHWLIWMLDAYQMSTFSLISLCFKWKFNSKRQTHMSILRLHGIKLIKFSHFKIVSYFFHGSIFSVCSRARVCTMYIYDHQRHMIEIIMSSGKPRNKEKKNAKLKIK